MTTLLVALGAIVGAPLRYLTDRIVQSGHDTVFPWGTFAGHVVPRAGDAGCVRVLGVHDRSAGSHRRVRIEDGGKQRKPCDA
jgi:hypothetical protein